MPCLVDGLREVPRALGDRGDSVQRGAENVLAHTLVRHHEEGVVGILDQVRNHQRAADIEAELVAAQRRFVPVVLDHFVRDRIEDVIAEVLINTPVPEPSLAQARLR